MPIIVGFKDLNEFTVIQSLFIEVHSLQFHFWDTLAQGLIQDFCWGGGL